jgi:type IV pilus assembly protein PilP
MKKKSMLLLGLSLTIGLATAGCGGEEPSSAPTTSDYAKERDQLAARKAKGEKPGKVAGKPEKPGKGKRGSGTSYAAGGRDYFYDPTDKRDPFRSFQFDDEAKKTDQKAFGPLADFELGQLELSAVIWDHNNPRALILDPGGRSYIVREGSQIGKNNGEVIHIGDNVVLVKETYENFAGERTTKDVELRIRLSQGG